jgi:prepilin-type N-terminal cleavage/methylation domain-containing protein
MSRQVLTSASGGSKSLRTGSCRGFTLIELLVVVALIALLAGLLLPVLAAARKKGSEATCTSNLRQIGAAMQMYLQDYSTRPPHIFDLNGGYVKSNRLFTCPADSWLSDGGWAWSAWGRHTTPPEQWPFPVSYGYFFNTQTDDRYWDAAQAAPGIPGYLVCVLHGEPNTSIHADPGHAPYFNGLVLRLTFASGVIRRTWPRGHPFRTWELMTDQERPPD